MLNCHCPTQQASGSHGNGEFQDLDRACQIALQPVSLGQRHAILINNFDKMEEVIF